MKPETRLRLILTLRWIARIIGGLLFAFFIWFGYHVGGPDFELMTEQEISLFIANIGMLVGLVVVWRWEFIGSLLLIGSFISFSIINHSFWIGPIFPTFLLVGIIHLGCWLSSNIDCFKKSFPLKCFLL